MSGLESDVINESLGAVYLGIAYFAIGCVSRVLVNKIDRALTLSATLNVIITIGILVMGIRDNSVHELLYYIVVWAYGSAFTQLGNTITGFTVRFLNWLRYDYF